MHTFFKNTTDRQLHQQLSLYEKLSMIMLVQQLKYVETDVAEAEYEAPLNWHTQIAARARFQHVPPANLTTTEDNINITFSRNFAASFLQ